MKYFLLFCGIIAFHLTATFANIVVTSKPLYFFIAPLLKGVETPKVIINQGQCGHHYHARPSEIQLIKTAKLILWNGPVHEPFMVKLINPENLNQKAVFDETDGLSWLSPSRVLMKLPKIVGRLKAIYPETFHATIDNNAKEFSLKLKELHQKTLKNSECLKGKTFLTTYPFLTYFARDYNLYVAGYMLGSPEEAMTPQRLRNMHKILSEGEVGGIIKDHHIPISVVNAIARDYKVKVLTVDAEAVDVPLVMDGYNILIERLVQSIVKWAK